MNFFLRFLLLLYPASWRAEYGNPMRSVLSERWRATRSFIPRLLLCLEVFPDLLMNAFAVQMDVLGQDLRLAGRTLGRSPGFTAAAVAIAALGIGATTAAFSMLNHVLFHPLPYAAQDRLVEMREDDLQGMGRYWDTSPANYRDWKSMSNSFENMGAYRGLSINLSGNQAEPQRIDGASITAEVLPTLGVTTMLGRSFTSDDNRDSSPRTVILSQSLWQEMFGADPSAVGRIIQLDNLSYNIIGVMPKDFYFPTREARLWTLMRWEPDDFTDRRNTYIFPVARLKPAASLRQAKAEMNTIATRLARVYPKELAYVGIDVGGIRDQVPAQVHTTLAVLFAASLCLLLIACMNLANLLLTRAMLRRHEIAVRAALGAGRERLVRQVLTESVLLAACGGLLGLVLAHLALPLFVRLVPVSLPLAEVPSLDPTVLFFSACVTLSTGIGFGIMPALRSSSSSQFDLQQGGRSGIGQRRERLRSALVVVEIACSVVLLVGFGLLTRALWRVQAVDPGFRSDHVLTLRTQLPMPRYEKPETREPFYRSVLDEAQRLPGVRSAAYTSFLPFTMGGGIWPVEVQGHPESLASRRTASLRFITPKFFATMGIPLVAGRDFNTFDSPTAAYVAIVSQSLARRYFDNENPIGQYIDIGNQRRKIVGLVGDIRNRGLERMSEPQVYASWRQPAGVSTWYAPKDLVIRTSSNPSALIPLLRRIIKAADPSQPISEVSTLSDLVDRQTASRRVELAALGIFGVVAVLLAAVGIHALLAFSITTRLPEIGVRLAVGATPADIVRNTLMEGLLLALIGLTIGLTLAALAGQLLSSLLAGAKPWDAAVFGGAILVALLMTFLGSFLPAVRASKIDPMVAMRRL